MTPATALGSSFIVAARRTALGRPGGLHRSRRLESLTAPVVEAALADAGLDPGAVDEIILGNTTAGGNPARLVGLAAGLEDRVPGLTVDRQCASGLDAILLAMRAVALGEANVIVAGGAESISTAPWRIARPKNLFQTPRFMALEPEDGERAEAPHSIAASEELARRLGITRSRQDELCAALPPEGRAGDEPAAVRRRDRAAPDGRRGRARRVRQPGGHRGAGRTGAAGAARRHAHQRQYQRPAGRRRRRGRRLRPRACRPRHAARAEAAGEQHARASAPARRRARRWPRSRRLMRSNGGFARDKLELVETSETSAAQALALRDAFDLGEHVLSPDGGALARGHALGAASAVSVVRLFTGMVRARRQGPRPQFGAVTQGAAGGLGVAALFEAV